MVRHDQPRTYSQGSGVAQEIEDGEDGEDGED
jgi:hypothetical protein